MDRDGAYDRLMNADRIGMVISRLRGRPGGLFGLASFALLDAARR